MSSKRIAIEWKDGRPRGSVEVFHGRLGAGKIARGKGRWTGAGFSFQAKGPCRIEFIVEDVGIDPGAAATRIMINAAENSFSFFLRDVNSETPMLIAMYGVMVVPAEDKRSYAEVEALIRSAGLQNIQQQIEAEPEETYEGACAKNRDQNCPTWLGLGRDMRIFEIGYSPDCGYWGYVQPRYHSTLPAIPETGNKPYQVQFIIGAGASCRYDITRRLDEGVLPILLSTISEGDVTYKMTAFATLETQPLGRNSVRGSDWRACYPNTGGNMLAKEDKEKIKDLLESEMLGREEETVCWVHVECANSGRVPRYAWFKCPGPKYDGKTGFGFFESGRVQAVSRLDGSPMPQEEMAILIQPGAKAVFDVLIPHRPLPRERALKLARQDYSRHLDACREFWRGKLKAGAKISVPEEAVDERIKAGLLHCDLVALGKEPDGPVLATIGWYAPIGSESSPIIQFFDSMGWHKLAERSLDFFLERQRADGFIQNFGGYQLETGPALWTMGEHYRYTRDTAWVRRVKPKILKACDFLIAWRNRNKRKELRGNGYGLLDGKVADPEDFFHSFMLNALSYVGIARAAEMLEKVDAAQSKRLEKESKEFRVDIRKAFYEALARSPVIPLGDGTWIPSAPPWTEYPGPLALYAEGQNWFTHGAFGSRDSLIGALYLVIGEVLDPWESGAEALLKSHQQLFTVANAGFSQPYYVRHDFIHAMRGEAKAFLKTFYNQFTALQDRETYTFWEHYFHASQHKTHEEGWFLMQVRWMLWLEDGPSLRLLSCIPRRWMEDGNSVELNRVASRFGILSLRVDSKLGEGRIVANVRCEKMQGLKEIVIRLPHPEGLKAVSVKGGRYNAGQETVTVSPFKGTAEVEARF